VFLSVTLSSYLHSKALEFLGLFLQGERTAARKPWV